MGTTLDHEYLTVAEAAALLKVDRSTIRRWIARGDLPAYRVGPRAVRLRRDDVARLPTPARGLLSSPWPGIATDPATIPDRLTPEEQARGLAALASLECVTSTLGPRRSAHSGPSASELLNEARDERDRQLDSRSQ